jgi:hypothetical protein
MSNERGETYPPAPRSTMHCPNHAFRAASAYERRRSGWHLSMHVHEACMRNEARSLTSAGRGFPRRGKKAVASVPQKRRELGGRRRRVFHLAA